MIIPVLKETECHVWWADPRSLPIDSMMSVLSDDELERLARLVRAPDRRRYITACWLLRTTAATQLGTTPDAVPIDRRCPDCGKPHGKPHITGDGGPLHASVSHSADRVAIALCPSAPIGVDVEEVTPAPIVQVALSPGELAALRTLPQHHQKSGFTDVWVRKEAVLKATGHGLRIPPDQVVVTGPRQRPALLSWPLDISPNGVKLHTLNPGSGYTGAIAILADQRSITVSESNATQLHQASHYRHTPIRLEEVISA